MSSYQSYYNLVEMALNFLKYLQSGEQPPMPEGYNPHIRTNPFIYPEPKQDFVASYSVPLKPVQQPAPCNDDYHNVPVT